MFKSLTASYLLFIGFMIGLEFAAGALIAPIIFFPVQFIGEGVLTHFQSGILMTQIFLRFNVVLIIFIVFAWIYEAYAFYIKKKDIISILLLLVMSICAYLFVFYFTAFILDAQKQGDMATKTVEFVSMHKGSEISMKVLMMTQIALMFRRFWISKLDVCE